MNSDLFNLRTFFDSIRVYGWWRVTFELLLIGIFVWSVVRFLQGTRGARLLKGIGVLLIALYLIVVLVGQELNLERLAFLYRQFLLVAAAAALVVFQPELRRALMRLGETKLFRGFSNQINEDIEAL